MGSGASAEEERQLFDDVLKEVREATSSSSQQEEYAKHVRADEYEREHEEIDDEGENLVANPNEDTLESSKSVMNTTLYENVSKLYERWAKLTALKRRAISVKLTSLEWGMKKAFETGKTPLIIDSYPGDRVSTFYSYQPDAVLLDAKVLVVEGSKKPLVDSLDYARKILVNAMKHGKLLVIRLGTTAPDFRTHFNDDYLFQDSRSSDKVMKAVAIANKQPAYFPREVLFNSGAALKEGDWADKLFREEDTFPHKNFAMCRYFLHTIV